MRRRRDGFFPHFFELFETMNSFLGSLWTSPAPFPAPETGKKLKMEGEGEEEPKPKSEIQLLMDQVRDHEKWVEKQLDKVCGEVRTLNAENSKLALENMRLREEMDGKFQFFADTTERLKEQNRELEVNYEKIKAANLSLYNIKSALEDNKKALEIKNAMLEEKNAALQEEIKMLKTMENGMVQA